MTWIIKSTESDDAEPYYGGAEWYAEQRRAQRFARKDDATPHLEAMQEWRISARAIKLVSFRAEREAVIAAARELWNAGSSQEEQLATSNIRHAMLALETAEKGKKR